MRGYPKLLLLPLLMLSRPPRQVIFRFGTNSNKKSISSDQQMVRDT
ncbi:hypothetical protein C2W64_03739 [Brevibacillus laterosporus]|nr:hypothetical protein C2W64_03739 [Brevibacillus laterosporus]